MLKAFLYESFLAQGLIVGSTVERVGDITLADFWGIDKFHHFFPNQNNGVSLVLINSQQGINIWENIKNDAISENSSIDIALQTCNKNLYVFSIRIH